MKPGLLPVCALALLGSAAVAASSLDEEIVVTARRVEERAGSVPLAVQVLTAAEFQRSSVNGLYAVSARAPGLSFESTWGGGVSLPTLRGQFSPSLGDTVGVFVDGVHQASRSALDVELLDFERIEVVYGPQSTLYGHGTFAGAIGYVSSPPTRTLTGGATAELGSDSYRLIEASVSGPLSGRWLGRLAASSRRFDGTITNLAAPQEQLGGADRTAVALTLALAPDDDATFGGSIAARYEDSRYVHPATASVEAPEYNCGARDRASGLWSYFCGPLPADPEIRLTPGLPDSETRVGQVLLRLGLDRGSMRLESDTSWYDASSDLVRDFDASDRGVQYGVCTLGVNCAGPAGVPRPVNRLVYANQVAHDLQDTRQVSQELRLQGSAGRATWMVGGVAFDTRDLVRATFGTSSGDLQPNEQLTAVLPATPQLAGPVSIASRSLVADPLTMQVERQNVENRQRSYALFGAVDYAATDALELRGELRGARERRSLDSRVVNFQPSFGQAIAPQWFEDVTTRLSVEYRVSPTLLTYLSAAKGSRPGGINAQPNLPANEQVYQPEYNWTWEVGLRHRGDGLLRSLDATAYYVDWRDTQINGLSSQLGLTNPIVLNTAGLTTRGIELAAELAPTDWLHAQLAWSLTDPEFRAGSDDYGSSGFCGLSSQNSTSSFCTVGPPRSANPNMPAVVPWLDGNVPGRAPRATWHAALTADLPVAALGGQGWARVDVNHQDDVYERQIDGAYFGRRTLVDARMGITRGSWSIELWGTNLTDRSYVRASFGKFPVFYPTQQRPLDQIYSDGRRVGVTVRWSLR